MKTYFVCNAKNLKKTRQIDSDSGNVFAQAHNFDYRGLLVYVGKTLFN